MDFNNKNLRVFHIGGVEVWLTETIVNTWIIMGLLIAFCVLTRIKMRKFNEEKPSKFQQAIEAMVEMFDNYVRSIGGDQFLFLGHWYFMVFAFVLFSNISGLYFLRPPTADWATTFALAFATLTLIQAVGTKFKGGKYWKGFLEPVAFLLPLNLIGELARPVSLSFRLFGNILAGMIIMSLLYALPPIYARFGIPAALHIYFDLVAGAIQTYIFATLSISFISQAATD